MKFLIAFVIACSLLKSTFTKPIAEPTFDCIAPLLAIGAAAAFGTYGGALGSGFAGGYPNNAYGGAYGGPYYGGSPYYNGNPYYGNYGGSPYYGSYY